MVENTPLINSYKLKFVKWRLLQTCLGGWHISNRVPWYVVLLEFVVWLYPWIIGGVFTLVRELGNVETLHASIGVGLIILVTVFSAQLLSYIAVRNHENSDQNSVHNLTIQSHGSSKELRRLLSEEDAIVFDSCFSFQVFIYIFTPKRYLINVFLHSILSGLFSAIAFAYALPSSLMALYQSSAIATVLYILSWIVICMAQFSLNVGKPVPETATYRSVDQYETEFISRAFHVFLVLIPYIVYIFAPTSTELILVNQILHWVLLSFPLLWLFGILPPVECLILWALEQGLIFGFGGSACSTNARLFLNILLSMFIFIGSAFINNNVLLVVLNAAIGYILSTDIVTLFENVYATLYSKCASETAVKRMNNTSMRSSQRSKSSFPSKVYHLTWHIVHFVLACVTAALLVVFVNPTATNQHLKSGLEYAFIAVIFIVKILNEMQAVSIFGLFRNYLFPDSIYNKNKYFKRKKILSVFAGINLVLSKSVTPLLCIAYVSIFTSSSSLPSWLVALGTVHAFRIIWQRPGNAMLNLSIVSAINVAFQAQNITNWWTSNEVVIQILIIDACRDRVLKSFDNLWFCFAIVIKSVTDSKQKRPNGNILLLWNIISTPLTISICCAAAVLASPVLPLFTLPLFLVGFPRPARFWPNNPGKAKASICADTVYYESLTVSTISMFEGLSSSAAFCNHAHYSNSPQYYIARSQDKTMLIQDVENGCGYSYFTVKGLELQETSCHALEATKLDDIFTQAFETDNRKPSFFGPMSNLLSSITPLDSILIKSYSDAKNSLVGILDQHDSVKKVRIYFTKVLIWLLLKNHSKQSFEKPVIQSIAHIPGQSIVDLKHNNEQQMNNVEMSNILRNTSARSHKLSLRSTSLDSFTSILSTDNETNDKIYKKPSQPQYVKTVATTLQNQDSIGKDWDDVDSLFSDSGFGLPAQDYNLKNQAINGITKRTSVLFPAEWIEIPLAKSDLSMDAKPSNEWMKHCIDKWLVNKPTENVSDELSTIALVCDSILNIQGIPGKQINLLTAQHIAKVFGNVVPWSPSYDWLASKQMLHKTAIKAFRYAVKLVYDEVSLGEIESDIEFDEYLNEYESEWFIGCESDPEWQNSITDEVKQLFSVDFDTKGKIHARVLTQQLVPLHIASINKAAVQGIWADLSLELIYATNDDEERYSIQAHQSMIRNLTIQMADPPLGYPIFISQPMNVKTILFKR